MSIEQNVNHPAYYGGRDNPYETIKVIEAWGLDDNFDLGNTIKYISRAGKKDKACLLQDLMKAQFYLNHEVEKLHKYDGNYEKMKADERKARLLDEKKELEEELDDLVSRFEKSDPIRGEGVIYDYVNCDDLIKAINKKKSPTQMILIPTQMILIPVIAIMPRNMLANLMNAKSASILIAPVTSTVYILLKSQMMFGQRSIRWPITSWTMILTMITRLALPMMALW